MNELQRAALELRILCSILTRLVGRDLEQRLQAYGQPISTLQYAILRMLSHQRYTISELSRKLLLAQGEQPAAQEDRSRPEIQARDGKIEAYMAILHAMFYDRLAGDALATYLSEHIFAKTAAPVSRK